MRKRIEIVDEVLYGKVNAEREAAGEKSIARTARRLLTERLAIIESQSASHSVTDGRDIGVDKEQSARPQSA